MADIFISYSRQDSDFARRLYRELERFRVRGFMDVSDISAGADFSRQIREAINSSDALLVILSKSAAESSYVMAEIGMAQSMGKTVLPILAPGENYEQSVPPQLLDRVVVDANSAPIDEVAAKIVSAITNTPVEVSLGELKSRTVRRQRILIATTTILLLLSVFATWMAYIAKEQEMIAIQKKNLAIELQKEAEERRDRIELLTSGNASMAIAPDGKSLATGSQDGSIKVWDMTTGQILSELTGHEASISSLSYSPDGRLIASASWDGSVALWDLRRSIKVMTLTGHTDSVIGAQFTPDGGFLLSRSLDGTVRKWDVTSGELVQVLDVPE